MIRGRAFPWVYDSPRDANARPFANLGKAYARFFNKEARRGDALHKLTTRLVRTYGRIVIEDLHIRGMVRNRKLSRAISDMGFGEFRRQLSYKVVPSLTELVAADRWFPSSRLCMACGTLHDGLELKDRTFTCEGCGHAEDRDVHAAGNLERYPRLQGNLDACGHPSAGQLG